MSPKKSSVTFGNPTPTIPGASGRTTPPAEHWVKVAEHVKSNPGNWIPVSVGHLSVNAHGQAATTIRSKKLFSFREPGFDAVFRQGVLYVRYDAPAQTAVRIVRHGVAEAQALHTA